VGAGAYLVFGNKLVDWLSPSVGAYVAPEPPVAEIVITLVTLLFVAVGVLVAYLLIGRNPVPLNRPEPVGALVRFARADAGGNAVNEALVARPGVWLGGALVYVDAKGVDGAVNGSATALGALSQRWRRWQNGFVRSYALSMLSGAFVVIAALLVVRFA
jgi:NADH-quinone oxidoreductase subunit L